MPGLKKLAARILPPSLVGRYRGWRVRRLIAGYSPRVVEHQYGAARLRIELTDPMAAGWYDHDWSELPEIETLRGRTLRPGACVFDIGAHHGVVALMLASEVGSAGQVIAVEANPHNASSASRTATSTGLRRSRCCRRPRPADRG